MSAASMSSGRTGTPRGIARHTAAWALAALAASVSDIGLFAAFFTARWAQPRHATAYLAVPRPTSAV
ncbi:hypothetical protein [Streptomyces hokutonensis]|uniref:hypothetical protein n=1 Tax=Streptomyces hokutonensis TaxID=1306990 RepID=UPI001319F78E|nr:hypothetical protein [Streptomyces hokutonensis]